MLIGLLTSILIAVVFMAGGLYGETHNVLYIGVGGLIAAVVGVLYGYISQQRDDIAGFEIPLGNTHSIETLLDDIILLTNSRRDTLPVYVAANGLTPISGMFVARLNGEQALILEGVDETPDTITVHRPLFEKAE